MQIVYGYSPMVESMSIDECFVDITGSKQFGTPLDIANSIQSRIMQELKLPCSIGVAPNKLLAKMGSDMKKPNGITVLRLRDVPTVFWDKPCQYLYGIGKKTAEKLTRLGILTLGQLAIADEALLSKHFGVMGAHLKRSANGIDPSVVNPEQEQSKSIGHTTTLPRDYTDRIEIHRVLLNLADQVARRLRKQELMTSTIQITIRDPEMRTITRSLTLPTPTEHMDDIYRTSCQLYDHQWEDGNPVRLLGITLQNLIAKEESYVQLDLFDYEKQPRRKT